jgi:threonine dehydrogenase-like Zn-dependent dehydrogenase
MKLELASGIESADPINSEVARVKAIAVFPQTHELKLIDVEPPEISSSTQAKIRMLDIGVCGTDREISAFQYGTPPSGVDYLVIGHESLGEVIEVGSAVTGVDRGDLVVTSVRRPCPHENCPACTSGHTDFCYTGDFTERGIKQAHGFMTEFVVDDYRNMNVVPPALRDTGVLVEPLTIAEKALREIWSVQERLPWACPHSKERGLGHCHVALVLGAGPVGLLGAMALARQGFDTYVYSREPSTDEKSGLVESFGAHYVSATDTPVHSLAGRIGRLDVVYEATGASQLSFGVIEQLGFNGIFVFTGVPGRKGPIDVDTDLIMRNMVLKNQAVFGSVNASKVDFKNAIGDLVQFNQQWPETAKSLITGRYGMKSYTELLTGPAKGIKNVLTISQ